MTSVPMTNVPGAVETLVSSGRVLPAPLQGAKWLRVSAGLHRWVACGGINRQVYRLICATLADGIWEEFSLA